MERRIVDGKTQLFVAEHRRPVHKITKRRAKKTKASPEHSTCVIPWQFSTLN